MQNQHWYPPNIYRVHFSASIGYRYQLVTRNAYFDIFWHNRACGRPNKIHFLRAPKQALNGATKFAKS